MFKNSYKLIFFSSMTLGTLISISANSWFSVWMGLEINLLSFIPLMIGYKNLFSSESSLKYFLIQAIASNILFFSFIIYFMFLNFKMDNSHFYMTTLISLNLMLKLGAAPFHFWLPSVMEGLNWYSNMIIMTWQKIAPFMVLSYNLNYSLLIFSIFVSMIFGSLGGLNQTSLRKLMAFSSINHLGWMMASLIFSENIWFIYFLFYIFLSLSILFIFNNFKLYNINQMFKIQEPNLYIKFSMLMSLLSLGGLPPFLGFFPKWIVMEALINLNQFFILLIMLFITLITLFFYLRISYVALLINHLRMGWKFKTIYLTNNNIFLFIINYVSLFGMLLINFFFYFI